MSMVKPTPMRDKPVKRVKQRKGLRRVSKKMAPRLRDYYRLRKVFLGRNFFCGYPGCYSPCTDVHHVHGRGKNLNDITTWMPICRRHHNLIHSHPSAARALGLLA